MMAMMCNAFSHGYRAAITLAAHALEHVLDMRNRRLRHDAVTKIENERFLREGLHDRIDAAIERDAAGDEDQGIEITLHWHATLNALAGKIFVDHPIEANSVQWNVLHIAREHRAG